MVLLKRLMSYNKISLVHFIINHVTFAIIEEQFNVPTHVDIFVDVT